MHTKILIKRKKIVGQKSKSKSQSESPHIRTTTTTTTTTTNPIRMTEPTLNFHIQTHQTQFKIPVELIKKNFKSIQKLIEKQKKQLTEDINKIKKIKNLSNESKLELIQKLIKNFEIFN